MPWYLLGIMVLMKRCVMGLAKIAQFSFSSAWELLANQLKFLMCFLPLFFHGLYPKRYCRFTPNFCQRLPLFLGSLNSNFIKILCHVQEKHWVCSIQLRMDYSAPNASSKVNKKACRQLTNSPFSFNNKYDPHAYGYDEKRNF